MPWTAAHFAAEDQVTGCGAEGSRMGARSVADAARVAAGGFGMGGYAVRVDRPWKEVADPDAEPALDGVEDEGVGMSAPTRRGRVLR
jgi:hypothetical protein